MSLMCLKCRGVGNASTVKELGDLVIKFSHSILCIQETQRSKARVESLASSLGYDHAFVIDSDGRSGSLGIF